MSMLCFTCFLFCFFFFKQKTAYEMRISDWSSDVCSSDLLIAFLAEMAQDKRRSAPPDSPFDPPYTTFNLGQIGGGKAINIVAQDCSFTWEYRPLPGEDADTILAAFEAYSREPVLPALGEDRKSVV